MYDPRCTCGLPEHRHLVVNHSPDCPVAIETTDPPPPGDEWVVVASTGSSGRPCDRRGGFMLRSQIEEQSRQYDAEREVENRPRREFIAKVAALEVDEVTRAILDFHSPEFDEHEVICCGRGGYEPPYWPCSTVLLLTRRYGLEFES